MRHNKNFNHLGRQAGHRKALMSNMASSLILHKRIETTVAKAKALRQFIEPLVTKSKEDTTHQRRMVFSYLKQKEAVTELFRTIAPKIAERPGGYTRILKTGFRLGDAADMCIIEFVDFNEAYTLGVTPAAQAVEAVRASPPPRRRMPSRMRRSSRRSPRRSLPRPAALRRPVLRRLPRRPTSARRCDLVSIPIHTGDPQRIARMCFSGRMQAGVSVCQRRSERSGQGEESASGGEESRYSENSDLSYGGQVVPAEDVCCVGRR